jgi:hypothetical protein
MHYCEMHRSERWLMLHLQAGDAAAVPRLQAMLLLATDALCIFNKPSGISVQVQPLNPHYSSVAAFTAH